MNKVRLSVCFDVTVEVDNDSDRDVQVQEAKDAMHFSLPHRMDDDTFMDCTFTGVRWVESEELT